MSEIVEDHENEIIVEYEPEFDDPEIDIDIEHEHESDSDSIEDQGDPIFYGSVSEEPSYAELLAYDNYREYDILDIPDMESLFDPEREE
jgi:hypothetical protein